MGSNLVTDGPLPDRPEKATLVGRFHHAVMKAASECSEVGALEEEIEREINVLQSAVKSIPSIRRPGSVGSWKEVNQSAKEAMRWFEDRRGDRTHRISGTEKLLRSLTTVFIGIPDLFYVANGEATLIDFKTSSLRDETGQLKIEYRDQLAFYSALLFETHAISVVNAILKAASGETVVWQIAPEEARRFQLGAAGDVARANAVIAKASSFLDLATPSARACTSCRKIPICELFHRRQHELGLGQPRFVVVGVVESVQERTPGQLIIVVRKAIDGVKHVVSLQKGAIDECREGDSVVITDLDFRGDRYLGTTQSCVYIDG